jgi:hypothetical protein
LQSIKVEQNNVIAKEILNRLHRKTFSSTAFCAIKGRSKKLERKNRETEKTEDSIEELKQISTKNTKNNPMAEPRNGLPRFESRLRF